MSFAVIVPTMGVPHLITFTQRLVQTWRGKGLVIYSVNPKEVDVALNTIEAVKKIHEAHEIAGLEYDFIDHGEPVGFGEAVNSAARHLVSTGRDFEQVIVLNDDIELTAGWRDGLWNGHHTKEAHTLSTEKLGRKPVSIDQLGGKVGLVGGVSFQVAGEQNIKNENNQRALKTLGIDNFSREIRMRASGSYVRTCFLSGFAISFSKELFDEIWITTLTGKQGIFEDFEKGGWEDNDLCYRAMELGYQCIIARDTYFHHLGHQTLNQYYPEHMVGMVNRQPYYEKWKHVTQRDDQKIIAAYRLMFKCVNDLAQFRSSIMRTAQLEIDGCSVLLTGDPLNILKSYDANLLASLPEEEKNYIGSLKTRIASNKHHEKGDHLSSEDHEELLTAYIKSLVAQWPNFEVNAKVSNWETFNEREERNETHRLAEDMGAEWIISVDSDEVFEDRLTPNHIRRLTKHPDPLVALYHFGWINHWESMNLVRVDHPFTQGLNSGMVGGRMWRVRASKTRIVGGTTDTGLHCGNSPEYSPLSARIASVRFRHLSHVRNVDRLSKASFYNSIDKNKDSVFITGNFNSTSSYNHISQADNVQVELYNRSNGICFNMLCYSKEKNEFIAQKLDMCYAVCDELTLTWSEKSLDTRSENLIGLASSFGVKWLHKEFVKSEGLSECRNVAIQYIRENLLKKGVAWCFFLDPDEFPLCSNHQHNAALRRCAEQNDSWGMMFIYKNMLPKGSTVPASTSQSVRMFKVDPKGIMQFSGRVHESLENSYQTLRLAFGIHPNVRTFPQRWMNTGLSGSPQEMGEKLRNYTEMIVADLEENALDSQSWLSLGLQYINEGDHEKGEVCFERSCMVAQGAFMPFKELATLYLNKALALLIKCDARLGNAHRNFFPHCKELMEHISRMCPPHPVINTGEKNLIEDIELPNFPYDRISIDDQGEFKIDTTGL